MNIKPNILTCKLSTQGVQEETAAVRHQALQDAMKEELGDILHQVMSKLQEELQHKRLKEVEELDENIQERLMEVEERIKNSMQPAIREVLSMQYLKE
jgi:NTP pyrophosphatase (non-canonical NTP hydrolase)